MSDESTHAQALPSGTVLGRYYIDSVLGSGGFGITYKAWMEEGETWVAIKENFPGAVAWRDVAGGVYEVRPRNAGPEMSEALAASLVSFRREGDTLSGFSHPGVVPVVEHFAALGTAYLVMPYIHGVSFDDLIANRFETKPFAERELRGMLHRVLEGLGYIHEHGFLHRDVKPHNLLISKEGVPILIDFGSARQDIGFRTQTRMESAGYTPFELMQSKGNSGPWSDLYALGASLHKAIVKMAPPPSTDRVFEDAYQPLASRPDLVGRFCGLFLETVDCALAFDIGGRWQSAAQWLEALRQLPPPEADPPR